MTIVNSVADSLNRIKQLNDLFGRIAGGIFPKDEDQSFGVLQLRARNYSRYPYLIPPDQYTDKLLFFEFRKIEACESAFSTNVIRNLKALLRRVDPISGPTI